MNLLQKTIFSMAAITAAFSIALSSAKAGPQDAAYDDRGQFISDSWGKCVRTKWDGDEDPCNPAPPPPPPPPPAPEPEPEPLPVIELEQRSIYFDFDSSELDDEGKYKLNMIAKLVNNSKRISDVSVVGYTDQFGTSAYNQKLSERRIRSVQAYLNPLVRIAVDPNELDIRALGKAPAEDECSAIKARKERIACMRKERRVEIEFKYEQ